MKLRTVFGLAWCVLGIAAAPAAALEGDAPPPEANALTLQECYALARERSETLAIHQEIIRETEGRFLQALSGALPRLSFSASQKWQDGNGGSSSTLPRVPERKFTVTQPLFSGFKEFAAMAGSRAERREREHERAQAEQLLLVDVSDAFYQLAAYQQDVKVLEAIHAALDDRLGQLKERERLGRSRQSELVSTEAQLRRLEAEQERVQSLERVARQILAFLTGLDGATVAADDPSQPIALGQEVSYVAKSDLRPDVQSAQDAWQVSVQAVNIARAQWFPTVSAESNYYTKRVGATADVDWDALIKVDVPIFQGGKAYGGTSEAAAKARQARLVLLRTQREAAHDIRQLYAQLQGAQERTRALQEALHASEEEYRLEAEDERLNLVNHLDVLDALQRLQDARRELLASQYEAKRLYWRLQAATGETL